MGHVRQEVKRANDFLMKNWNIEAELKSEIAKVVNLGFEATQIAVTKAVYAALKESYCKTFNIPVEETENIELKKYAGYELKVLDPEYFNCHAIDGFGLPFRVNMRLPEAMLQDDFYSKIENQGDFEELKAGDGAKVISAPEDVTNQLEQNNG